MGQRNVQIYLFLFSLPRLLRMLYLKRYLHLHLYGDHQYGYLQLRLFLNRLFDLKIKAIGDTHIDDHHTNEDVGIALGKAFSKALGERKGISRFGHFFAPLDEALVQVTLDCSGRPHLSYDLELKAPRIGNYDTELVKEFFIAFVNNSGITLHINQIQGSNSHHIVEACFKAFSRAMRMATEIDLRRSDSIPSSKGMLENQ